MNQKRHIILADSSLIRSDEMERLAFSLHPATPLSVKMFEAYRAFDKNVVAQEVAAHVDSLLGQQSDIVVVTNCIMGVQSGLIKALRELESKYKQSVRKVLLTCKRPYEIRSGFAERGLSLEGIEHVFWNVLHSSLHRDRMTSIFQGNPPEENPL